MEISDGNLLVTSPSFKNGGEIPLKHTGYSSDVSPAFKFKNLDTNGKSIAIIMDDLDVPFTKAYPHWVIFNLPLLPEIPENIPYGADVEGYGAKQGLAYGKNRYRGPFIPAFLKKPHRYRFAFYILDDFLSLDSNCRKGDLLKAMNGHILQTAELTGTCRHHEKVTE